MMLVVLLIGVVTAAVIPVALNNADQARTRSFLRQVIALNQYARSRAVLDNQAMLLIYDPEAGVVSLQAHESGPFLFPEEEDVVDAMEEEVLPESQGVLLERFVPDTMRIRAVEGAKERDEQYWVVIERDGVGPSYEVEIMDPRGSSRWLSFNGFTGEVDEVE